MARALLVVLLLAGLHLAGGCASGRPRLPARIIDDPVTVPRGMVWVAGLAQLNAASHRSLGRSDSHAEGAELRFGLGKRVELVNLLALRLAVLDDSPARSDPDALALAVKAGLGNLEVGDDFLEDADLIPLVRVDAGKRVATRLRLGAHLAQRTYVRDSHAFTIQHPTLSSGGLEGLYQVTETLAVRAELQAYRWHASARVWRAAVQGGFGPGLSVAARPRHWFTVAASANLVYAWAAHDRPSPDPDRRVAQAQAAYAEPRLRILILGAQAILHN